MQPDIRRRHLHSALANPAETASYIHDLVSELAKQAEAHGFELLGYFLRMAELEAKRQSDGPTRM
jgi:hypothetical protein